MQDLQDRLGYHFKDRELLDHALTHSSFANENKKLGLGDNERLEFLGDSILGQVTAEYLYNKTPAIPEGNMSKFRSELVCETALYEVAKKLDLGSCIRLGKGEESTGGRDRPSILSDAVEALIAAIYLDGGYTPAKAFISEFVLTSEIDYTAPTGDWKTLLQEHVQKTPGKTIEYRLVSESGPDHNKRFTFCVLIDGTVFGEGTGRTKRKRNSLLPAMPWNGFSHESA